jgi:hypothetical protein
MHQEPLVALTSSGSEVNCIGAKPRTQATHQLGDQEALARASATSNE